MKLKHLTLAITGFVVIAMLIIWATLPHHSNDTGRQGETIAIKIASGAPSQQLFELRIYTAAPGKLASLHQRFRDHTLRLFKKHGISSIGYWTEAGQNAEERLYYLVAYPNRESRDRMLVHGIAKDPEFLAAVAESEKEGKLTTSIDSVLLNPTDYSALK